MYTYYLLGVYKNKEDKEGSWCESMYLYIYIYLYVSMYVYDVCRVAYPVCHVVPVYGTHIYRTVSNVHMNVHSCVCTYVHVHMYVMYCTCMYCTVHTVLHVMLYVYV